MKENFSKMITSDLKKINNQIQTNSIDKDLKIFINKNINFIKRKLKDLVQIKTHGSYATGQIYKFEKILNIDLLAVKYVKNSTYNLYENEIETENHIDNCLICKTNEKIYNILVELYNISEDVKIIWNEKKTINSSLTEPTIFKDSLKIEFYKEEQLGFSILIRTVIKHSEYPLLICSKKMYKRSFTLEYLKKFRTLNNLLIKKLQILFYNISKKFRKTLTKKELLILKLFIMSDIQYSLIKNINLQKWLDFSFNYYFLNKKSVDNILDSKNLYYKRPKKISKFYNSFKLKNLKWVFAKSYSSTKDFLSQYLEYSKNFIANKSEYLKENIYFWYDSIAYLKNTIGSSNISIKKENQKYDNLDIQIYSKTIYPTDKENGLFLIFLQYFNFEVE
ncbi:hypothetical protein [Spiroplasma floricola]|uniref:Uncharacterized protein n=1 Tax=Spiroplasma floricola 23-6 TaxID=1336749 RepID=A0A2K8SDC6_9MOLU|nr:hypothetical protein [Spiroplasma floricola]AUB31456.1 hypothetical protein SFLOR_v1c04040 [Spiroplasma floricola 23-6]